MNLLLRLLPVLPVLASPLVVTAQTVYIPSGTSGIGSSSTGHVGVGTSAPSVKLEVANTQPYNAYLSGTAPSLYFGPNSGVFPNGSGNPFAAFLALSTFTGSYGQGKGDLNIVTQSRGSDNSSAINFLVPADNTGGYTMAAKITREGKVGIGTANPNELLEVAGNGRIFIGDGGGAARKGLLIDAIEDGNSIRLHSWNYGVGAGMNLLINPYGGGNVGIGTTSPSAKLSVRVVDQDELAIYGPNNNTIALQTLLDGQPLGSYGTYGGGENRLILQPLAGNVGIGTTSPGAKLDVVKANASDGGLIAAFGSTNAQRIQIFDESSSTQGPKIHSNAGWPFVISGAGNILLQPVGNVGIGTTNPTYKLAVNGTIRAKEVIVESNWSDYVFAPDYRLAPLSEVEQHIKEKQHLPGIPSAAEVAAQGVSVGEMQSRLLAKIEELTLHQIAQNKRLDDQAARIAALEKENAQLRHR